MKTKTLRQFKDQVRKHIRALTTSSQYIREIEILDNITAEDFTLYAKKGKPFIHRKGAKDWPLTQGGINLFNELFSNLLVTVRQGDYSRGNKEFSTQDMTVKEFQATFNQSTPDYAGYQKVPKEMLDYINYPLWLQPIHTRNPIHFWFGPKGTYTAVHSDTSDKLVYQCFGDKRWYLIAPQFQKKLNIDEDFGRGYDTSPFDPRKKYKTNTPKLDDIPVISFELHKGDIFYLPAGWYHAIESLDQSLSFEYKSDPVPLCINDAELRGSLLDEYGFIINEIRKEKSKNAS